MGRPTLLHDGLFIAWAPLRGGGVPGW
eukprot:SAG11_NODE_6445_length_1312_cov_0.923331_1_plen_26_part_01